MFWLKLEEVEKTGRALDAHHFVDQHLRVVAERRATSERERTVTPPVAIPSTFLGIEFSRIGPSNTGQAAGNTIKGQGTSPGRVTGIARVIRGPAEFGQMQPGDILVARITTPAWTPLFALAAGIITDVGGPLSHGSIVARMYHVPAVLGTGVATERIRSGQRISVDGDRGLVTLSAAR